MSRGHPKVQRISEEMIQAAQKTRQLQDSKLSMAQRVEEMLALSSFLAEVRTAAERAEAKSSHKKAGH